MKRTTLPAAFFFASFCGSFLYAQDQPTEAQYEAAIAASKNPDPEAVQIGMSLLQMLTVAGQPSDVNRTITASGEDDQYVFGDGGAGTVFIYTENNTVTALQD